MADMNAEATRWQARSIPGRLGVTLMYEHVGAAVRVFSACPLRLGISWTASARAFTGRRELPPWRGIRLNQASA